MAGLLRKHLQRRLGAAVAEYPRIRRKTRAQIKHTLAALRRALKRCYRALRNFRKNYRHSLAHFVAEYPRRRRQTLASLKKYRLSPRKLAVGLVVVIIAAGVFAYSNRPSPLPKTISKQISFSPLVIKDTAASPKTPESYRYDKTKGVLSYTITLPNKHSFIVSEQATPPNFVKTPDLYGQFLTNLNKFDSVQTNNGFVSLTRPQGTFVVGVLNEQGALVFIRTNEPNMPASEWKTVAEMLNLVEVNN